MRDEKSWRALLERYLEVAPDAPDRDHVKRNLGVRQRFRSAAKTVHVQAWDAWIWLRRRVRLRTRLHWYER